MKSLVHCKALVAVVLLVMATLSSRAQSCEEPRTPAIVAYLQYKGAGWEMGWWPAGSPLGVFGGMSMQKQQIPADGKDSTVEIVGTQVYGKLQLRLYEGVAVTTAAGLINGQEFYYTAGLRFNLPLNNKTAIIGEPQIGNKGFNFLLGVAKRF